MSRILITGGAGYIGSHTCVELLLAGHEIVVLDNLCNSRKESLRRVTELTGRTFAFVEGDIRDRAALDALFRMHAIDSVIHFAGLKAVGESVEKPLLYWDNNVCGSVTLLQAMAAAGVKTIVFSSSCTVYGDPASVPIREDSPIGAQTNPYGRSKLVIEQILADVERADPAWRIALLRYFNPVGAHASGRIGEDPRGIPNNLVPYVAQVAVGRRESLNVFGDDYPTPDGTGIRDYLHVVDLAVAHVKAVEKLEEGPGIRVWNLGTGRGCSVLEVVRAFEKASGRTIPYRVVPRRLGDIAQTWADPSKAERELGWKALRGLDEMCVDSWRWQERNPNGFGDAE
ncbi:MAG: UDP-glucose 4-epimerase GalE [Holophagales bacterium]|jgi:UDP-glucose 4-epimerase|nr:UDP-glucose 4-epimerase GalE [Holophagales bacterium]MBK9964376.1 UDP-glucose 4-epimerase GalE [Holophagales bacterium]